MSSDRPVAAVSESAAETDLAVYKTSREIALLQEFRTRLVADVVMGQVDVRAVAAALPDAPEAVTEVAVEPNDEAEELLAEEV